MGQKNKEFQQAMKTLGCSLDKNGDLVGPDGCWYEEIIRDNIREMVAIGVMGTCTCGHFDQFMDQVHETLKLYRKLEEAVDLTLEAYSKIRRELKSDKYHVLLRWFDALGWEDHGASLPVPFIEAFWDRRKNYFYLDN